MGDKNWSSFFGNFNKAFTGKNLQADEDRKAAVEVLNRRKVADSAINDLIVHADRQRTLAETTRHNQEQEGTYKSWKEGALAETSRKNKADIDLGERKFEFDRGATLTRDFLTARDRSRGHDIDEADKWRDDQRALAIEASKNVGYGTQLDVIDTKRISDGIGNNDAPGVFRGLHGGNVQGAKLKAKERFGVVGSKIKTNDGLSSQLSSAGVTHGVDDKGIYIETGDSSASQNDPTGMNSGERVNPNRPESRGGAPSISGRIYIDKNPDMLHRSQLLKHFKTSDIRKSLTETIETYRADPGDKGQYRNSDALKAQLNEVEYALSNPTKYIIGEYGKSHFRQEDVGAASVDAVGAEKTDPLAGPDPKLGGKLPTQMPQARPDNQVGVLRRQWASLKGLDTAEGDRQKRNVMREAQSLTEKFRQEGSYLEALDASKFYDEMTTGLERPIERTAIYGLKAAKQLGSIIVNPILELGKEFYEMTSAGSDFNNAIASGAEIAKSLSSRIAQLERTNPDKASELKKFQAELIASISQAKEDASGLPVVRAIISGIGNSMNAEAAKAASQVPFEGGAGAAFRDAVNMSSQILGAYASGEGIVDAIGSGVSESQAGNPEYRKYFDQMKKNGGIEGFTAQFAEKFVSNLSLGTGIGVPLLPTQGETSAIPVSPVEALQVAPRFSIGGMDSVGMPGDKVKYRIPGTDIGPTFDVGPKSLGETDIGRAIGGEIAFGLGPRNIAKGATEAFGELRDAGRATAEAGVDGIASAAGAAKSGIGKLASSIRKPFNDSDPEPTTKDHLDRVDNIEPIDGAPSFRGADDTMQSRANDLGWGIRHFDVLGPRKAEASGLSKTELAPPSVREVIAPREITGLGDNGLTFKDGIDPDRKAREAERDRYDEQVLRDAATPHWGEPSVSPSTRLPPEAPGRAQDRLAPSVGPSTPPTQRSPDVDQRGGSTWETDEDFQKIISPLLDKLPKSSDVIDAAKASYDAVKSANGDKDKAKANLAQLYSRLESQQEKAPTKALGNALRLVNGVQRKLKGKGKAGTVVGRGSAADGQKKNELSTEEYEGPISHPLSLMDKARDDYEANRPVGSFNDIATKHPGSRSRYVLPEPGVIPKTTHGIGGVGYGTQPRKPTISVDANQFLKGNTNASPRMQDIGGPSESLLKLDKANDSGLSEIEASERQVVSILGEDGGVKYPIIRGLFNALFDLEGNPKKFLTSKLASDEKTNETRTLDDEDLTYYLGIKDDEFVPGKTSYDVDILKGVDEDDMRSDGFDRMDVDVNIRDALDKAIDHINGDPETSKRFIGEMREFRKSFLADDDGSIDATDVLSFAFKNSASSIAIEEAGLNIKNDEFGFNKIIGTMEARRVSLEVIKSKDIPDEIKHIMINAAKLDPSVMSEKTLDVVTEWFKIDPEDRHFKVEELIKAITADIIPLQSTARIGLLNEVIATLKGHVPEIKHEASDIMAKTAIDMAKKRMIDLEETKDGIVEVAVKQKDTDHTFGSRNSDAIENIAAIIPDGSSIPGRLAEVGETNARIHAASSIEDASDRINELVTRKKSAEFRKFISTVFHAKSLKEFNSQIAEARKRYKGDKIKPVHVYQAIRNMIGFDKPTVASGGARSIEVEEAAHIIGRSIEAYRQTLERGKSAFDAFKLMHAEINSLIKDKDNKGISHSDIFNMLTARSVDALRPNTDNSRIKLAHDEAQVIEGFRRVWSGVDVYPEDPTIRGKWGRSTDASNVPRSSEGNEVTIKPKDPLAWNKPKDTGKPPKAGSEGRSVPTDEAREHSYKQYTNHVDAFNSKAIETLSAALAPGRRHFGVFGTGDQVRKINLAEQTENALATVSKEYHDRLASDVIDPFDKEGIKQEGRGKIFDVINEAARSWKNARDVGAVPKVGADGSNDINKLRESGPYKEIDAWVKSKLSKVHPKAYDMWKKIEEINDDLFDNYMKSQYYEDPDYKNGKVVGTKRVPIPALMFHLPQRPAELGIFHSRSSALDDPEEMSPYRNTQGDQYKYKERDFARTMPAYIADVIRKHPDGPNARWNEVREMANEMSDSDAEGVARAGLLAAAEMATNTAKRSPPFEAPIIKAASLWLQSLTDKPLADAITKADKEFTVAREAFNKFIQDHKKELAKYKDTIEKMRAEVYEKRDALYEVSEKSAITKNIYGLTGPTPGSDMASSLVQAVVFHELAFKYVRHGLMQATDLATQSANIFGAEAIKGIPSALMESFVKQGEHTKKNLEGNGIGRKDWATMKYIVNGEDLNQIYKIDKDGKSLILPPVDDVLRIRLNPEHSEPTDGRIVPALGGAKSYGEATKKAVGGVTSQMVKAGLIGLSAPDKVIMYGMGRLADAIFRRKIAEFGVEKATKSPKEFIEFLHPDIYKYEPGTADSWMIHARAERLEALRNDYATWAAEQAFVPNGKTDRPFPHVMLKNMIRGSALGQLADGLLTRYTRFVFHRGHQLSRMPWNGRSAARLAVGMAVAMAMTTGATYTIDDEKDALSRGTWQALKWAPLGMFTEMTNLVGHEDFAFGGETPKHMPVPQTLISNRILETVRNPQRMLEVFPEELPKHTADKKKKSWDDF